MKRKSLFALSALVVAAAALVPVLWSGSDNLHNGAAEAATPADQAALIKRGEYLARAGDCIACHTVRGGQQFAGGLPMATPFGTLYTPNITP
ncbi:MAG: cytochrome c, partial [Trinickia sp.]